MWRTLTKSSRRRLPKTQSCKTRSFQRPCRISSAGLPTTLPTNISARALALAMVPPFRHTQVSVAQPVLRRPPTPTLWDDMHIDDRQIESLLTAFFTLIVRIVFLPSKKRNTIGLCPSIVYSCCFEEVRIGLGTVEQNLVKYVYTLHVVRLYCCGIYTLYYFLNFWFFDPACNKKKPVLIGLGCF